MDIRSLFTAGKGNVTINIDNTELEPTYMMARGGKFEVNYLKYLESLIYNDKEMEFNKFIHLIVIMECLSNKQTPIKIQSNKYPRLTKKIIHVLSDFIDKNYKVLNTIFEMYVGKQ